MFRAFATCSRKLLTPKPLTALTLTQEPSTSGSTAIYDVRRNNHINDYRRAVLPLRNQLQIHPLLGLRDPWTDHTLRWASGKKDFKLPDPSEIVCNMINMLKCVDLYDMKDAPPPAFWTALVVGGTQLAVPFLEVIGGYSPVMTFYQLYGAALVVGFQGGIRWGLSWSKYNNLEPSWENMQCAAICPAIAVGGLLLPYPLGFLSIASGMVVCLYLDLKSCAYPPWACAIELFIALATITSLLLGLSAYVLFHNREKNNKEVKDKEKDRKENDDDEEGDDNEKKE